MNKIYLLDTNVLLHDPRSLSAFGDNEVVIPLVVLDELDKKKDGFTEVAKNARVTVRALDQLRLKGNLSVGVQNECGGTLRIEITQYPCPAGLELGRVDNRIIGVAAGLMAREEVEGTGRKLTLISKDINLRIKCDAVGILTEDYNADFVADSPDELYTGIVEVTACSKDINLIHAGQTIETANYGEFYPNQYVHMMSDGNTKHSCLARNNNGTLVKIISPGSIWGISSRNREQACALDALLNPDIKLVTMIGLAGSGKAQPLSSPVMTPTGYRKMGDLAPGDLVATPKGGFAPVKSIHPQGKQPIYRVWFSDGTSTRCTEDHLWLCKSACERWSFKDGEVRTLKEISKKIMSSTHHRNYSIPTAKPVQFEKKELKIPPYLLGALLGDGAISQNHIYFSNKDREILERVERELGKLNCKLKRVSKYDYSIMTKDGHWQGKKMKPVAKIEPNSGEVIKIYKEKSEFESPGAYSRVVSAAKHQRLYRGFRWTRLSGDIDLSRKNNIKKALLEYGLECKSKEKFIPAQYLLSSVDDRIQLLRGLMDTDGTIRKDGIHAYLSTSSKRLKDDFCFLVESLGGLCTVAERRPTYVHLGEKRAGSLSYRVSVRFGPDINPFFVSRKANKCVPRTKYLPTRFIDRVEPDGCEEAQCIYIDDEDHLYLTDHCIVTHNTLLAATAGVYMLLEKNVYKKMVMTRPVISMGKDLGYLPGDLADKLKPWIMPLEDNLELIFSNRGQDYLDMQYERGTIQVEALSYIRGRSIPNSYFILDEAQNLSSHEVKTAITRIGDGSKIVLSGDIKQIDTDITALNNGLSCVVEKFKDQPIAAHLTLKKGERSELATIAAELL